MVTAEGTREHEHDWHLLSECCSAEPIDETSQREGDKATGFCGACREGTVFEPVYCDTCGVLALIGSE